MEASKEGNKDRLLEQVYLILFPLCSLDRAFLPGTDYTYSRFKSSTTHGVVPPFPTSSINGCKLDATVILTCTGRTVVPVIRTVSVAVEVGATQQAVQELSVVQLALMVLVVVVHL